MRPTRRALPDLLKNLALTTVSFSLCLLLAETATRALLFFRTPDGMIFEDDIIYSYAPRAEVFGITLNNLGCIGDDFDAQAADTATKVLLLGGSTSFSTSYVEAIKDRLVELRPDLRIVVASCGRPRYTSFVNRVNYETHLRHSKPNVVAVYEGINDNIYNSFPWAKDVPTVGYFNWAATDRLQLVSLFAYHVIDKRIRSRPHFAGAQLRSSVVLESSLRRIAETARQDGAQPVFATFAISYPTSDSVLLSRIRGEEAKMQHFWGDLESTVFGVKTHNQVIRELAHEMQVPLAEVADKIPRTSAHFGDLCHMTPRGAAILGSEIASTIAASGGLDAPALPEGSQK